jgi:hypothetical protein
MPYQSSSAASYVSLARFGSRIIPAMQPSAARRKTAECVAKRSFSLAPADRSCVAERWRGAWRREHQSDRVANCSPTLEVGGFDSAAALFSRLNRALAIRGLRASPGCR